MGVTCIVYSAQPTVEEAATKWISHSKDKDISDSAAIDFHPSELLDIIARNGHSLPVNLKNELIEKTKMDNTNWLYEHLVCIPSSVIK